MRRGIIALVAITVLSPLVAHADAEVTAGFYGVVSPNEDYSQVQVAMVCEARAAHATSVTSVTCAIDDGQAGTGISETCDSPGPEALCPIQQLDAIFPVTICAYAVATLSDLTTATDTRCRTYTPPTT